MAPAPREGQALPAYADHLVRVAEAVGLLRSGATPAATWEAVGVGPVDQSGVPSGLDDSEASQAVRAACVLAHTAGAPLAEVLDAVSEHLQRDLEAHAGRQAAMAGPTMSAAVLSWLPLAGLGLGALIDARALEVVAATPLGWTLVTLAGALTWAGRRWMSRMVAEAKRAGDEPPEVEHVRAEHRLAGPRRAEPGGRAPHSNAGPPPRPVPVVLMLALIEAAISAGLEVRGALAAVGQACGGVRGTALVRVADALAVGVPWEAAWERTPTALAPIERALRSAWTAGMAPRSMVRAQAQVLAMAQRMAAERAVGELGVRMSLPLTLCLLPAFALVGVVPMVVAVASNAGVALG